LTDPTIVPQIAQRLRDGTGGAWTVGDVTWNVGPIGDGVELNARLNTSSVTGIGKCDTGADAYTARPELDSGDWGGVNTNTCNGPSQTITVTFCRSAPTPPARQFRNISSRVSVGTGDNVGIGGFVIKADPGPQRNARAAVATKEVLIRGIGPSLKVNNTPVAGRLMDPYLELHDQNGNLVTFNDDWADTQAVAIEATGAAPSDSKEAAILIPLNVGDGYTAILSGLGNDPTGIGLIEVFDLEINADSHLINISTRGFVDTGDDVLIGGIIVQGDTPAPVVLRAIGPSLNIGGVPVAGRLADPVLELRDPNGMLLETNDNWGDSAEIADIIASGLAPADAMESAILFTPAPGNYTAIVSGVGATTGIGLVEAYRLNTTPPKLLSR
jgi:hypothetical protein